jgi:hypothetical protein
MVKIKQIIPVINACPKRRRIGSCVVIPTIAEIIKPIITIKPSASNVRDRIALKMIIINGGIPAHIIA